MANLSVQLMICIYPPELQLKQTTECSTSLSYLDVMIIIDNGKYSTAVYDKRDNFNFHIAYYILCSNTPFKLVYGVHLPAIM